MPTGRLPPGPPLPRVVQTLLYVTRTVPFLQWCRRRYGDFFTGRLLLFGDVVFISDPAVIKELFRADPKLFHGGEPNAFLEPLVGARSLFLLDEDDHLRNRRIMLPAFHGERLRSYRPIIEEITDREIDAWPIGRPFRLRPHIERITIQIMLQALFGVRDDERLGQLQEKVPALMEFNPLFLWIPSLRKDLGRWSPWHRFSRQLAAVDEILTEEMRGRRQLAAERSGEPGDMLDALLQATDEQGRPLPDADIRDQLRTVALAGYEPPTTAMCWLLERLIRHPEAMDRLRSELAAGETAYLEAVIKEAMRARPTVTDFARALTAPTTLGGHLLPAGTVVAPSVALAHLDAERHPDPDRFAPERFLDDQEDMSGFIPFGGGVRRCLGASLATAQMEVVVETVLRRLDLRPARPRSEPRKLAHVTLVPKRGVEVLIHADRARAGDRGEVAGSGDGRRRR